MPVSFKGAISFGMVYIPITLHTAAGSNTISFNQLHKECGGRIRYKKTCPSCNIEDVKQEDIDKGYEYEKNKYVIMEDGDFEKIKSEKDKTINILMFSDLNEIDPIYFEKSYYVLPEDSDKAYELLRKAMIAEHKVAIAKAVLGFKETLMTIRPTERGLMLETMYFAEEIKEMPKAIKDIKSTDAELTLAKTLIQNMAGKFDASAYHDEYNKKIREAIDQKIKGEEIVSQPDAKPNIIDLMEALKKSVKTSEIGSKEKPKKKKAV